MMTCDLVCELMDQYLEHRLSHRDQERIEEHLGRCPRCRQELGGRLAFEDLLRHRLTVSVGTLRLPTETSSRIVRAAQRSAQRSLWSRRLIAGGQLALGVAAVILLMVGLIYSLGRVPTPLEQREVDVSVAEAAGPEEHQNSLWIEPARLVVGEAFTVTVRLYNQTDQPMPAGVVALTVKRSGASGSGYRFEVPLGETWQPGERWGTQYTPQDLQAVCVQEYGIELGDVLAEPGLYSFRVTFRPGSP